MYVLHFLFFSFCFWVYNPAFVVIVTVSVRSQSKANNRNKKKKHLHYVVVLVLGLGRLLALCFLRFYIYIYVYIYNVYIYVDSSVRRLDSSKLENQIVSTHTNFFLYQNQIKDFAQECCLW